MTTYSAITSGQIDAESYIDTVLAGQWANNALAIQEGDASAPDLAAKTGASKVLLDTQTAANSATVDFTSNITSAYDKYVVSLTDVDVATNASSLYMRLSQAGTFIAGSNYYGALDQLLHGGTSAIVGMPGQGAFTLVNAVITSARSSINGFIYFSSPDNTAFSKHFHGNLTWEGSAGNFVAGEFGGIHIATAAMDGVRFLMSSGNITAGVFRLYGIKDS